MNELLKNLHGEELFWFRKLVDRSAVLIKDLEWPYSINYCTMRDGLSDAEY